jgi:hypothetical protein
MTDYTDDERAQLAQAAQAGTELRFISETLDRMRQDALEALANSKMGEDRFREKLYHGVQAIDALKQALVTAAASGEVVEYSATLRAAMADS